MKLRLKDKIIVLSGKDKGKEGEIVRTYSSNNTVLVKGINMYKKHVKKSEAFPQGGLISIERALPSGKVALICPHCKKRTRVGYMFDKKDKKVRICRSCKKAVS